MSKAKPWLTISDGTLTDLAVARAEHNLRRIAMGSIDPADRSDLERAISLRDRDKLVAFLRRKPLLGEITPAAYRAILDVIEKAPKPKAQPQALRNQRTRALHAELAHEVWKEMVFHPELSKKEAMGNVARRHKFKKGDRTVERACTTHRIYKPKALKKRPPKKI
jgi:hypothetical protein